MQVLELDPDESNGFSKTAAAHAQLISTWNSQKILFSKLISA